MSEDLKLINYRIESMETSLQRMEASVTEGMKVISDALKDVAVVMSKLNDNTEEHKVIHRRIDDIHTKIDENSIKLTEIKTTCDSRKEPKKPTPIRTALIIASIVFLATSYAALLMIHSKELIPIILK